MQVKTRGSVAGALAMTLLGACVGAVGDGPTSAPAGAPGAPPSEPGRPGTGGPVAGTPGANGAPGTDPVATDRLPWPVDFRGTPSALRRLSRDEILTSAQMLLGAAPARGDLPEEPRPEPGALLTAGLSFVATEVPKLQTALSDFATRAAPGALAASGCVAQGQAQRDCLLAWTTRLVALAWRRPLDATETARFNKLLDGAGASRDADTQIVTSVLTATLFSPSFLYRTEVGTPVAGRPGVRALDGYEVASRLSFLATLAPPDAALLDAARAGRLATAAERTQQLQRLLATDRGKRAVAVMVLEWLGAGEARVSEKSSRYLTGLPASFESASRASAEAAIRKVLGGADPTLGALLTTTGYLDDPALQPIRQPAGSGKTASGDPDAAARIGLMMHPHVLAAHTKEDGSSPFPIGFFLRQALLCQPVPPPPPDAAASAPVPPPGLTVRQSYEFRTNAGPACQSCHPLFSPLGYAFLPFDPVGRWVKQDPTGKPWDLSGSVTTYSGASLTFQSPADMMQNLAQRPQVHGCFAQAATEWMLGRHLVAEDADALMAAADTALRTRASVPALLEALVASPGFVNAVAAR